MVKITIKTMKKPLKTLRVLADYQQAPIKLPPSKATVYTDLGQKPKFWI